MGKAQSRFARVLRSCGGISLAGAAALLSTGCNSKNNGSNLGIGSGSASLMAVESGALVDVFGLRRTASGAFTASLFQRDVLIGSNIVDERDGANRNKRDNEILYDFLSANPDNLQPRLLITREIGSAEFTAAYDALDDRARRVTPGRFGQDTTVTPFTVIPRNGAMRLTFSRDLGIDDSFFYTLENGQVTGVKNTEAVQVLRIVGDPNDANNSGDFEVIPARFVARGNSLIIDPVLLGTEGVRLQSRNQAGGLPASADQIGANIRVAIAVEGPLAIPGIKRDLEAGETGLNNGGLRSIVRDLRSGNSADDSSEISRGFRRDPVPPRIIGEILMYLERVEEVDEFSQLLTIYKHNVSHRIDVGDAIRVVTADGTATPIAVTEIVANPEDRATESHTRVLVRREEALSAVDPSKLPGYPSDRQQRELWLLANAPRAVLVAEYEYGNGADRTDDPQYFVRFSPSPIPDQNGASLPSRHISPFAAAIVRFSKPLDLTTVRAQDSLFFATLPLRGPRATSAIEDYLTRTNMDRASFDLNKFTTPHLVVGQRNDEDGSQTTMRLQPPLGFYLDDEMRVPANVAFRTYFLHVVGGRTGIKDLAGNELDFLADAGLLIDGMVIDFTLDERSDGAGRPLFPNNRVVNIPRRFETLDEDEQPSYYLADEIRTSTGTVGPNSYPLEDLFGAVNYIDGRIQARPTARVSRVADDLNQQPPPPQTSELRWCPASMSSEGQIAANTATVRFGQPIQNPLNPYGSRLMTIWRELDLNLSRVDPFDFNLDVEEAHWAPHSTSTIVFDEFDNMSLYLAHSEYRAENCVGDTSALPDATGNSGLLPTFQLNIARDLDLRGVPEVNGPRNPGRHVGYEEAYVVIDAAMAFTEPNNVNRYMPLPPLEKPYFVWRDETLMVQGGRAGLSSDTNNSSRVWEPYIISPWLMGGGRYVTQNQGTLQFNFGRWFNSNNYNVSSANRGREERISDGLVGAIALPLLADFQMVPDTANLPEGRGYVASGANGWQVSLAIQSSAIPNFRVYSGGGVVNGRARTVAPGSAAWSVAAGGINPLNGLNTIAGDNTFYWAQWDFLKRQTVVTSGFVDVLNPHRVEAPLNTDPRLGPYFPAGSANVLPTGQRVVYTTLFEPPLSSLPGGTELIPQYRGASIVDPAPWVSGSCGPLAHWTAKGQVAPTHLNFPLDPRKAGDAHIRKFEDGTPGTPSRTRNFWVYPYNQNITDYVDDPNLLSDSTYLQKFAAPTDSFRPNDVRYFNWRFIMKNNVEASPPVSPELESFAMIYRFEQGN